MPAAIPLEDAPPIVAVTGPRRRWRWAWWATRLAVRSAGGVPVYLYPGCNPRRVRQFDALVVGGGDDLDPGLYGEHSADPPRSDPDRDAFEQDVLGRALEADLPVLGICRGAQLLNVVRGGSLHQDISAQRVLTSNRRTLLPRKRVTVDGDALLATVLDATQVRVNSLHHQAIREPGDGLRVVARDLDDIIQAVEDPTHRFRIGVQWHPEYLAWQPRQWRLFRALVEAAAPEAAPHPAC